MNIVDTHTLKGTSFDPVYASPFRVVDGTLSSDARWLTISEDSLPSMAVNLQTGESQRFQAIFPDAQPQSLDISPDGMRISGYVTRQGAKVYRLYFLDSRTILDVPLVSGILTNIWQVCVSPDYRYIAVLSEGGNIHDTALTLLKADGSVLWTFKGFSLAYQHFQFAEVF